MSNPQIFVLNRTVPAPLDTLPKKPGGASKYSGSTKGTLFAGPIKAFNAYCDCLTGARAGAVGEISGKYVAEYSSSTSPDMYHLVVYDPASGSVMAGQYDQVKESAERYTVSQSEQDGAALFLAMMPKLLEDDEFSENFEKYYKARKTGFPDVNEAGEYAVIMCDNAYRRVGDETNAAHVKVAIEAPGNVMPFRVSHLDSGDFVPQNVLAGCFQHFAQVGADPATITLPGIIPHSDFVGQYKLSERSFSESEQTLIPEIPEWYVIPTEMVNICKHAKKTSDSFKPMRNFLLRGPAGTGKTEGARALAAGLGLPYVHYTCNANTEIQDITIQVLPVMENAKVETNDALTKLTRMQGGVCSANVSKLLELPDEEDMKFDPVNSYRCITGETLETATEEDCKKKAAERVSKYKEELLSSANDNPNNGQQFVIQETSIIEAFRYGYCLEIQEPTVIMQPGVLVGLNSLLEYDGSIRLATGETVKRHPETVVVVTSNVSYEGCRELNRATRSALKRCGTN